MPIRVLVFLFLISVYMFASLDFSNRYQKEVEILNSLDIDPRFLNDPEFMKIQNEFLEKYRKKHFFKTIDNAFIYIPTIKRLINEAGIPQVFLFMAMAESNFSPHAYSNKKATGVWQFMPATAKKFGLKIDDYVDERKDPIKSTKAAIKYLKHLHNLFGKWYLAALAYNTGEGRVKRAIKKAGTDELSVLIDPKKRYLPRESRRYLRKIVALALMAGNTEFMLKDDFDYILNRGSAYSLAIVEATGGDLLRDIARSIKMDHKELKKLNAHLKYDFVPPYSKKYNIYIPYIKLADFKENYRPSNKEKVFIVYKVKKGDTLSKIGKRYGVSYKIIKDFNDLKSHILRINQKLVIPVAKAQKRVYTVKKGDTLISISKRFGLSVAKIKKINSLKTSTIRVGEKIVILN
ncbi:lytic transglycosylase domain-containing protein [Nitrosophilus alvini]|uniref:lytic transglycosylase domain-containing protein n=1 Tax=Nitrosophilus alvini TaxID=2714855 RepID=UPI00190C49C8|nr:lytic transglycosylase domain-containing protein [Nitrosophilus alvini]